MGGSDQASAAIRAELEVIETRDARRADDRGQSADVSALGTIPDDVCSRPFVPRAAVRSPVDAVSSQSGSGAVIASPATGRPMVVVPIGTGQPNNARAVERIGASLVVEAPNAAAVRAAAQAVLTAPPTGPPQNAWRRRSHRT